MRCSRISHVTAVAALTAVIALAGCSSSDEAAPNPDADAQAFLALSGDLADVGTPVITDGLTDVTDQNGDGGWKDEKTGCVLTGTYDGGQRLTCGKQEYTQDELAALYAALPDPTGAVATEKGAIQLARRFAMVSSDRGQSYADLDLASAAADVSTPQVVDVPMTLGEIVPGESVVVHHGACSARITFVEGGEAGLLGSVSSASCD